MDTIHGRHRIHFRSDHHVHQHTHCQNNVSNIILMADKHNIPKGKMHNNCKLLPDHIVCQITQRTNIRRANTCDPALKLLNEEIIFDIQKHKQNIWKEHLDAHWDHRHNTHNLWKNIHRLSIIIPPSTLNTSITFNNKLATTPKHIANCFTKKNGHKNAQQCTTHDNAPKGSGSYLRPKTHIQHIQPQHLSTRTHTSTNHIHTHCNRMG